MAKIAPFRGIVYNQKKAGNLSNCVCPPYDVISPAFQQELYQKNQYNVVRLEFGQETSKDTQKNNRYTRAVHYFQEWIQSGILHQSDRPALYVYEMEYNLDGETKRLRGFIGRVRIEDFSSGIVLPHENTLSGPKADRLNLIRTCRALFSQIYSLYSDPEGRISRVLDNIIMKPEMTVENGNGVTHRVWPLTDKDAIDTIVREMADKPFFIADGHHRYETALEYRNEQRNKAGSTTGAEPYDFVTMYLARLEDPALTILPAHRAVYNLPGFDPEKFEHDLNSYFDLERFDFNQETEPKYRKLILERMADQARTGHVFGMRLKNRSSYYLLTLRNVSDMQEILPDKSPAYRKLDVSILHHLVVERLLGIKMEMQKLGTNIEYIKEADEAVRRAENGTAELVFLMNPTKVSDVKSVAGAGERMPQKATYFYPKLLTGMVMDRIE